LASVAGSDSSIDAKLRFGPFEFEPMTGCLRKNGRFLRFQPQPAKVLSLLLSRPGDLILREEFQKQIWGNNTFVDFERGLNFSIRRLRATLDDHPENPKYIETVPRRGYRFIADLIANPAEEEVVCPVPVEIVSPAGSRTGSRIRMALGLLVAVACAVLAWSLSKILWAPALPTVTEIRQITNDGHTKVPTGSCCAALVSDDSRVYFSEIREGRWVPSQVSAMGGEVDPLNTQLENAGIWDISPDHSSLLISAGGLVRTLWRVPLPAGSALRVGDVLAHDATWGPDEQTLVYAKEHELCLTDLDATKSRRIASFDKFPFRPRWSPDHTKLRFSLLDPGLEQQSLWELSATGKNPHPLFGQGNGHIHECCGMWTPDGRYFVYQSTEDGVTSVWARREEHDFWRGTNPQPVRLTSGPMNFSAPSASVDGKRLFVLGQQLRGELMRDDKRSREFVPYLSGISAEGLDFSRDGQWVVYVTYPDGVLWRSRLDGSQRLQLSRSDMHAGVPRWSPDGHWIVFTGLKPDARWKAYVVSANGGNPESVDTGEGPEFDSGWSPDGAHIIYAESFRSRVPALHVVDLRNHSDTKLKGSEGMFSPRWSPSGRFIVALSVKSESLMIFDQKTERWEELVRQRTSYPLWSRDEQYVYFSSQQNKNASFYRVRRSDRWLERLATIKVQPGLAPSPWGFWTGFAPDYSPLLLRDASIQEIYALEIKWP
jgi:Tol biopolymer transport system component/DNA-binding winged helix-turn-helix (wHTH) protein